MKRRHFLSLAGISAGSFLIPRSTVRQIQEISQGNADPLILVPERADLDLIAVEDYGAYSFEFGESEDDVEPPSLAEFIDGRGYNPHEKEELLSFLEEWGYTDPEADEEEKSDTLDSFQLNLDEPITDGFFDHWIEWDYALRESPKAQAYSYLESLPLENSSSMEGFSLGELSFIQGDRPGSNLTWVEADCIEAVVSLQHRLNELDTGVQISFRKA